MRTPLTRRVVATLATLAAVFGLSSLAPSPAHADTTTLNIVGTSDVSDSNLFAAVLKPGFEKAYPQYTVTYSGNATQQAINLAEGAATGGASTGTYGALIVHAASLENQFVADGYSVEPYGRAIFWGDFVLLGPANDPAGIMSGGTYSSDPAAAFQKLAAAGAAGNARLVVRETGSGTDVASHAIWAATSDVSTCTVSATNGGGARPSTTTGDCPTADPLNYPDWYEVTAAKQAANIQAADSCATYKTDSKHDDCYVFTDRGTYQYLQSTNAISKLQVVVRGSSNLLVNSFHAYAINPAKINKTAADINEPAAKAFLAWVTSPEAQAAVGNYLNSTKDAPFLPDAAPKLTSSFLPPAVKTGKPITVTGSLKNVVPDTPALVNVPVMLQSVPKKTPTAAPVTVATGATDANGNFSIRYTPTASSTYSLATNQISQIENASLNPVFGDLLQPTSVPLSTVEVASTVKVKKAKVKGRYLHLKGKIAPKAAAGAKVVLYASHPGHKLKKVKGHKIKAGKSKFNVKFKMKRGKWRYQIQYVNSVASTAVASPVKKVTVR